MALVGTFGVALLALTTAIHYEVLRILSGVLPALSIPPRTKLIVVIISAFLASAAEIVLYALFIFVLVRYLGAGTLGGTDAVSLTQCVYFSAETYSSLGYGDVVPGGALRLLAGVEVLNGLLLIGWSASYIFIAMERFWSDPREGSAKRRGTRS